MALTSKDVKAAAANLPHPREWKTPKMETLHRCEDGRDRFITFSFRFETARTSEEIEDAFRNAGLMEGPQVKMEIADRVRTKLEDKAVS